MKSCPSCSKDSFKSEQGVRTHHAKVHGENLPNRTCEFCREDFYDPNSSRSRCPDCPDQTDPPPENFDGSIAEWVEKSPYQRYYQRNKGSEKERAAEYRQDKVDWLKRYKQDTGCSECGYDKCSAALEFHHPKEDGHQEKSMTQLAYDGHSVASIKQRIERLKLLCSNCHREVHNL